MLSILTFVLHLPLLSIALSTDLVPRADPPKLDDVLDKFPQHELAKTGNAGRCIHTRWPEEVVVRFNNTDANLVFVIESALGAVLCFVPSGDLARMSLELPTAKMDYKKLFSDRLLGERGDLTEAMTQITDWRDEIQEDARPKLLVFDIQILAPDVETRQDREPLVQKMASELEKNLQTTLKPKESQTNWKMPIYWLEKEKAGWVVLWKYTQGEENTHYAKLWMTGASDKQDEPIAKIQFGKTIGYSDPQCGSWSAFGEAQITYGGEESATSEGTGKPTLKELKSAPDGTYAKDPKWMKYNDKAASITCEQVIKSPSHPTLLGYVNEMEDLSPVFLIQTLRSLIMCYIPNPLYDDVSTTWSRLHDGRVKKDKPTESDYTSKRDALLKPLEGELGKLVQTDDDAILGCQFSAIHINPNVITDLNKDLLQGATEILKKMKGTDKNLEIAGFTTLRGHLHRGFHEEYLYNLMWHIPTEDTLWIWTMKGKPQGTGALGELGIRVSPASEKSKSPIAKVDYRMKSPAYTWYLSPNLKAPQDA